VTISKKLFFELTILATLSILAIVSFVHVPLADTLFRYGTYYLIFLLFILWIISLVWFLKELNCNPRKELSRHWPAFLIALILTILTFVSVPPKLRILHDEANIISISQAMTYDRSPMMINGAELQLEYLKPVEWKYPERPFLFPFMLHIIHTLFGYRPGNAFALNFTFFVAGMYKVSRSGTENE